MPATFSIRRSPRLCVPAWVVLLALPAAGRAGDDADPAASRPLPIERYLIRDRAAEIALARSAAPVRIGAEAAVLVLGREGYREASAGTNGFACLVGRSWSAPLRFASGHANPEFWSTEVRAPMCLNPEAVRTILPSLIRRTGLAIARKSLGEIEADASERFARGVYRAPSAVAMSFMLSRDQQLGLGVGHFVPHVMLYAPHARSSEWGGSGVLSGWPFVGENEGNPHALVIIPVGHWSDGGAAEGAEHHPR